MIDIHDQQILIDGKPRIIIAGEIHYYRLPKNQWEDRIEKLIEAGCNTVASYIPWLCHEEVEGEFDFTGINNESLNLDYFLSLCEKHGLFFIARPGPFIMAEMKNEGIPFWVYKKHPDAIPISWDGRKVSTATLDYLNPGFLFETQKWYHQIMPLLEKHSKLNGKCIIGVQLDNEIGMLSWVSNSPDLTDLVLVDFSKWLLEKYGDSFESIYPFSRNKLTSDNSKIRSPESSYIVQLTHDLGYYMRFRSKKYVDVLKKYAINEGIKGIPFIINVHGTSDGHGYTFPIGISQLFESYHDDNQIIPGTDVYFGNLSKDNVAELFIINEFMKSVNDAGQPLTSMEFNCGNGNFGDNFGETLDQSASDLKIRLYIAQGAKLINYYLFCGGYNYELKSILHDGNNRIATTGERHGFAAPVSPEGDYDYTFSRLKESTTRILTIEDKLANMKTDYDNISFAFLPDDYMTEFHYPTDDKIKRLFQDIEKYRSGNSWDLIAKSLLLNNYTYDSINIQDENANLFEKKCIIVPSTGYMAHDVQLKLIKYIENGGNILLYGRLPLFDELLNGDTALISALGISFKNESNQRNDYYLSVQGVGNAKDMQEFRTDSVQTINVVKGQTIFVEKETQDICGTEIEFGSGKATVILTSLRGNLSYLDKLVQSLNVRRNIVLSNGGNGVISLLTSNKQDEHFLHLLNIENRDKRFIITKALSSYIKGKSIWMKNFTGLILPVNISIGNNKILFSNMEIQKLQNNIVDFAYQIGEPEIFVTKPTKIENINEFNLSEIEGNYKITPKNINENNIVRVIFD